MSPGVRRDPGALAVRRHDPRDPLLRITLDCGREPGEIADRVEAPVGVVPEGEPRPVGERVAGAEVTPLPVELEHFAAVGSGDQERPGAVSAEGGSNARDSLVFEKDHIPVRPNGEVLWIGDGLVGCKRPGLGQGRVCDV